MKVKDISQFLSDLSISESFKYLEKEYINNKNNATVPINHLSAAKESNFILNSLSSIGIYNIVKSMKLFSDEDFKTLISSDWLLEKNKFTAFSDPSVLTYITDRCWSIKYNPVENSKVWEEIFDNIIDNFNPSLKNDIHNSILDNFIRSNNSYVLNILSFKKNIVNWGNIYLKVKPLIQNQTYRSSGIEKIIQIYAHTDPIGYKLTIDKDLFEDGIFNSNMRGLFYSEYIKCGLLDKKKARKIRSESSEGASLEGVRALFEVHKSNPNLYPNFEELIIQFNDTKYHSVQQYISLNSPISCITSFFGFDNQAAKSNISKRLNEGK